MALVFGRRQRPPYSDTGRDTRKYSIYFISNCIKPDEKFNLVAKLQVRLLKSEKFLAIGNKIASSSDLQALMTAVSKDLHLLRPEDLNVRDKMNYDGCERLCKPHVRELLKKFVPGKKKMFIIERNLLSSKANF